MHNYKLEEWLKSKKQLKENWAKTQILRGLKKHKGKRAVALYHRLTTTSTKIPS